MNASDLLVACLEGEGVEYVFGVPGEETEDLLFSIRDSSIEFIPVRHEQGAAFMANVHGRLTGEAGVCLGTLGSGATNLMTGVADANLDKAPLVAITGQGGLERLHKESHQALDIVQLFEPITKWNTQLNDPDIVAESVRKAFKLAEYEKPGATHLEFPEDVAGSEADATPMDPRERVRLASPDPELLQRAQAFLEDADRPLIIAGNGAVRTDATTRLREFVQTTGIPVASTYMGKGAISDRSPQSLLTLDSGDHQEASDAIETADLILTVGYDIAEHDPAGWNKGADTVIVHIDSEPAEVYEAYNPNLELVCDLSTALARFTERMDESETRFDETWYRDLRDHIVDDVATDASEESAFTVRAVLPVLRDVMRDNDVLISDVGSHKVEIAQSFLTYEPNTCIISNGLASMGISVPGGIAADLATDAAVVAATGDGGFLMNGAEIETATRMGCGYTILLFTDDDYGLISEKQQTHRGESFGTELTNPDFMKLAESFSIEGHRPEERDELEEVLRDALTTDEMSLVEIPLE
ncbi:acetolactate synthase large subunit [Halorubrum sp. JWXQ-INN 858]|uniref:acetolactate synthase large subunit n=1 Tax=Halorubrum sp. JWXQ-INN 858 TaxID=2690782 RepID=UPI00135BB098|nr:acetolactate synthase large subunit [Halorubrum sp. JWXQ-INN 858]MWV65525.1 acetolactate synthase large subunit [Halorubrum sp. JWXQ-INN 858]